MTATRSAATPRWLWAGAFVLAIALAPVGLLLAGYFALVARPRERLAWITLVGISLAITLLVWVFR